jgi:membrane protein YqaA with SNARE-associated domain
MLEKLAQWVEDKAQHAHASKALALVAFTESSFFPIPPFVLIIAMLAHEKKPSWVRLAIIGTISSVLGGVAGYFLGKFFYSYIGGPLIAWYGLQSEVASLGAMFKDHVFATIFLASISPAPYKVFTISAGLFSVSLWQFIIASIVGRSLRFFVVSYLSQKYGLHAKRFMIKQQRVMLYLLALAACAFVIYIILQMQGIL